MSQYDAKLCSFMEEYDRAFIVHADNVGSKQFMDIRAVLPPAPPLPVQSPPPFAVLPTSSNNHMYLVSLDSP